MPVRHKIAFVMMAVATLFTFGAYAQSLGSFLSPGPLAEPHAEMDTLGGCLQCHEPGQKGVSEALCMDCHDNVRNQVNTGTGFHASRGEDCASCHDDHQGTDFPMVTFEKETFAHHQTGFPLEGEHATVECADCHTEEPDYTGLFSSCLPCHDEDDLHDQDGSGHDYLQECADCHAINPDWAALPLPKAVFSHTDEAMVDYVLEGKHTDVECLECHEDMHFVPVEFAACTDCHSDPHRAWKGSTCEDCHPTPATWEVEDFDHDQTGYTLRGLHQQVSCTQCHAEDKTRPVPHATCASCHVDVHRGEFKPRTCDDCHTLDVPFASIDFDHDQTRYPLVGDHQTVECAACHGEGREARFTELDFDDCSDCHEDAHPGFFDGQSCNSCHEEARSWRVPDFDHDQTGYALEGEHATVECESCHTPGSGPELPHDSCNDCHSEANPHNETVTAESCESCHTVVAFTEITFDHQAETGFPLEDAHAVPCTACHSTEQFIDTPSTCQSCHEEDRPEGHFEGDCGQCHVPTTWPVATLGELGHGVTGFALEGSHAVLECADCHDPDLPQQRVGTTCSSCHASDDAHRNMVGDDCGSCHMQTTWYRTRWTHSQTGYPLTGSHRLAACQDCHATGTAGTPRECVLCHEKVKPDDTIHQAGFADHCGDCHKTYSWDSPLFPH